MKLVYLKDQIKGWWISLLLDILLVSCRGSNNFFFNVEKVTG